MTMVARIKEMFLTQKTILVLTLEWEYMDLVKLQRKSPQNSLMTSFNNMFSPIQELQLCLPHSYHNDDLLKSRLLNAGVNVDTCRLARQKVSPMLMGFVADIQTSISTHKETVESSNPSTLLTDLRHFQQTGVPTWCGRRNNRPARKCFVCKKFSCWSTNHPREERTQALKENTRLRAFVMDIYNVGNDEIGHDKPEPLDYFEALPVNYLSDHQNSGWKDEKGDEAGKSFLTQIGNVGTIEYCLYHCNATAYHAFSHSIFPPVNFRYSSHTFHGLAIDAFYALASTCGLEQYKAYCKFVAQETTSPQTQNQ